MIIKWTKEHLVRFTEELRKRTGFNPPPRVKPFDRSEVDYIEAFSVEELKAIGSAVQKETKGLYNGYPEDNIIEPVEKASREKFPFKPSARVIDWKSEPNYCRGLFFLMHSLG